MYGVRIENMRVIGSIIKCMGMVKYSGLMVANMKGNMKMIRNMVKELSIGLMEGSILVGGKMGNNMEKDIFTFKTEL